MRPIHRHQPLTAHPTLPPPAKFNPHIPNTRTCPQGHVLVFPSPCLVPNTRTRPQDLVVAFWCPGIILYHSDTENATTGSRSPCQGRCEHPRQENATPVSRFLVWGVPAPFPLPRHEERVAFFVSGTLPTPQTRKRDSNVAFSCLGCPCALPTTLYHPSHCPGTKNATTGSRSSCQGRCQHPRQENATPVSRFRVWGVPAPFPPPFPLSGTLPTPQTRKRDPSVAFLCLGCPCTLYHPSHCPDTNNATPVSRFRVWDIPAPFPPPSTTQTGRTRPLGHVLHVWGIPP